jgi:Ca-activated chloride channel family protein
MELSYLNLTQALSLATIVRGPSPTLVYALLEIVAGVSPGPRPPIALGLVIDLSESMLIPHLTEAQFKELAQRGHTREVVADGLSVWEFQNVPPDLVKDAPRSIDFVQTALRAVVEQLDPGDRFALVGFASQAQVLVPASPGDDVGKTLHDRPKDRILCTLDRLAQGDLGDETLMAPGLNLGLGEVRRAKSAEHVPRLLVITDGFARDAAACWQVAQQAHELRVPISTLGVGAEFNEDLLIDLAERSGGNAHLAWDPADIPYLVARELRGVQSVTARNVELKLRLTSGIELRRVYRVRPAISDLGLPDLADRSCSIPLGDFERDAGLAVLLELLAPPRPSGTYRLAQVVLAYDVPGQAVGEKERADVVVEYVEGPGGPLNPMVMNVVERVHAHRLQTVALAEALAGNVAGATVKLRAAATRLLDLGRPDLAAAALQEADNLERQGQMSAMGTKKLRYETRRLDV